MRRSWQSFWLASGRHEEPGIMVALVLILTLAWGLATCYPGMTPLPIPAP